MDYCVLEKEGENSKGEMLDLGKCIDESNGSAEENMFPATSTESDREEVREGEENSSSTAEMVAENDHHIMKLISETTPEVESTSGLKEDSDPQAEKSVNVCDSATDNILKEIIDMTVVGVGEPEEISQTVEGNIEKGLPVTDQSSTDEDSSKSLASNETSNDSKNPKTLDDILDDYGDENSDTVTSHTSTTSDTDDNGSSVNKNPIFEGNMVHMENGKTEENLQENKVGEDNIKAALCEFEEEENLQRLEDDQIREEETENGKTRTEEVDIAKEIEDVETPKYKAEEEISGDITSPQENLDSSVENKGTKTDTILKALQIAIQDSDLVEEETPIKDIETEMYDGTSTEVSKEVYVTTEESKNVICENIDDCPRSDNNAGEKNHNVRSSIKKGLKLSRHNINTETIESPDQSKALGSENDYKRDIEDSEEKAKKRLKTDDISESSDVPRGIPSAQILGDVEDEESRIMEDTEEISNEDSIEDEESKLMEDDEEILNEDSKSKDERAISVEDPLTGFETDPLSKPEAEKEVSSETNFVEETVDSSNTSSRETKISETNEVEQEESMIFEEMNKDVNLEQSSEKPIEEEETKSLGKQSSDKPIVEEETEVPKESQVEDENLSIKPTVEIPSSPHKENTESMEESPIKKAKTLTSPSKDAYISEERNNSVPEKNQENVEDSHLDFDEESIENISRTIRSFTHEKTSPKKDSKTASSKRTEESPSKRIIKVKMAANVERVKRKLEEILEKSKGEEDEAIAELQKMKKEKTDILNAITTEMEKLKSMLVKGKQG